MDQPPRSFKTQTIQLDYLARTEGETNLVIKVGTEQVEEIKLKIFEPPRFFEGFLVGRKFSEAGDIVSRICGICPISHMTTSLQAVEKAMGLVPSEQTKRLRRLMCLSQLVASHVVHLYMFSLPDYFGYPSFIKMMPFFEKERDNFLLMKEAINNVAEQIGGRPLNPISMVVNGFTKIPSQATLLSLAEGIEKVLPLAIDTLHLLSHPHYPLMATEGEFASLRNDEEYAINEGHLITSGGLKVTVQEYHSIFYEQEQGYALAKKSFLKTGATIMVGALSRMNHNFNLLEEETKRLAEKIGFSVPDKNPFHNNLAQAVEIYDGMIKCLHLLRGISPQPEKPKVEIREGEGLAITEAPRGLLMHSYTIDKRGVIRKANLITPTSHNFANIEKDLRAVALRYSYPDDFGDLKLKCEQLVRAYDPCFSCSVH